MRSDDQRQGSFATGWGGLIGLTPNNFLTYGARMRKTDLLAFVIAAALFGCDDPPATPPTDSAPADVPDATALEDTAVIPPLDAADAALDVAPPPDVDDGCLRRPGTCGPSAGILRLGERACGDTYSGEDSHDGCGRMPPTGYPVQSWRFDAPTTGRYTITVTPGMNAMARDGWTVALGIIPSSCNDMVCLGYARATEVSRPVSVTFDAVAGQFYSLRVGKGNGPGNYGPYTLSVRAQ